MLFFTLLLLAWIALHLFTRDIAPDGPSVW